MSWLNFIFKRSQLKKIKIYSFSHKNSQFLQLLIRKLYRECLILIHSTFVKLSYKLLVLMLYKIFFSQTLFISTRNVNMLYSHFFLKHINSHVNVSFTYLFNSHNNSLLFSELLHLYIIYCYNCLMANQLLNEEKIGSSALPYHCNYYTLLKSPHTDKKSREQFISSKAVMILSKVRHIKMVKNILVSFNIASFVTNQVKFINI